MKPRDLKAEFRELGLKRPEQQFVEYPSIPSLLRSIRPYQKAALKQLSAKGLIDPGDLSEGRVALIESAIDEDIAEYVENKINQNAGLFRLVVNGLGELPLEGPGGIYFYTRIPRNF